MQTAHGGIDGKLYKAIVTIVDERVKAASKDSGRVEGRLDRIENAVEKLADAQTRTEKKVEELAEAQKETQKEISVLTKRMDGLAVEVNILAKGLNLTRKDLGGVTSTLGYMLENEAYRVLPEMLKKRYGIEATERFLRRSIRSFGVKKDGEVNIFSKGTYKGKKIIIIGEAKSRLEKEDIDGVIDISRKLKGAHEGDEFLLAVTHYARESVIEYGKKKGVEVIQSFEW
ncbi:MAG: hypothetical protein HZA01_09205 [Nitrospinae bacterium]|nr:hypothetical protein [Nitrospinota bacterium]